MLRLNIFLVIFLGIVGLYSCKSKSVIIDTTSPVLETLLKDAFVEKHKCVLNQSESLLLCYADDDPMMDPDRKAYVVIDKNYKIVKDKSRVNGTVAWHDDVTLIIRKWDRNANKQSKDRGEQIEYFKIINTEKKATYEF